MAKIKIAGNALVVESGITMEQIRELQKYNPKALAVYDKDDNGKAVEVFRVGAAERGDGELTARGAVFTKTAPDGSGKAVITTLIPGGVSNAQGYAADKYGAGITRLIEVESGIGAALEQVAAKKAEVASHIEVC